MPKMPGGLDRGPAKYFHGRKRILDTFRARCDRAVDTKMGTIFMIQGAPGAGKTALTYQCMEQAEANDWKVADISFPDLYSHHNLARRFRMTEGLKRIGNESKVYVSGKLGSDLGVVQGEVTVKSPVPNRLQDDAVQLLRRAARKRGLLLVLDEAQTMRHSIGQPGSDHLTTTLNLIHNGKIGAPVMLLTAGLSTTEAVFDMFGISRFERNSVVYLQRLKPDSAMAVLRDYLTISGGVRGQQEALAEWVSKLEQHTHGWPAHIASWGEDAADILQANGGQLTAEAWASLNEAGRKSDELYYRGRFSGIEPEDQYALARLLSRTGKAAVLRKQEVTAAIAADRSREEVKQAFEQILSKGVLAYSGFGDLVVPIPSMHNWLVDHYQERCQTSARTRQRMQADNHPAL